ncbi:hypothetical protein C6369_002345 [Rhodococcus rhodochrous]|nr:hypothetical protein C6369_002345 [Rhodococcus rhodochrous]
MSEKVHVAIGRCPARAARALVVLREVDQATRPSPDEAHCVGIGFDVDESRCEPAPPSVARVCEAFGEPVVIGHPFPGERLTEHIDGSGELAERGPDATVCSAEQPCSMPSATLLRAWSEWQYESDLHLPVRSKLHHQITWLHRMDHGRLMRAAAQEMTRPGGAFAWVACDGHTTRSIVETLSHTHGLAKAAVEYRAYWK